MSSKKMLTLLAVAASGGGVAYGQAAPSTDAPKADSDVTEIFVTGSRVAHNGAEAPTPVTVVAADLLQQTAPTNIPDALNKLPIFSNSANQTTGGTFAATAAAKGNYLNLRALGSQRLLTLLNGSRVIPTTNSNAVDANMLPQLLVSRVDVVTGGASAVYGSDAVTGVVNYVLDEKYRGLKAVVQTGLSDKGDDLSFRAGVAFGFPIGDRFSLIGSFDHYKSAGIPRLSARSWATPTTALTGAGTAANPFRQTPEATTSVMTFGGLIATGALAGQRFRPDGTLTPFVHGTPTGSSATESGGDGATYTTTLAARLTTDQGFLRGAYDFNDTTQLYFQGLYGRSVSGFDTQAENQRPASNRTITIFSGNPFLAPSVASAMATAGQTSFTMGRFFNDIPLMFTQSVTTYYSAQIGLKGEFGSNWKWDVNYVPGKSKLDFLASEWDSRKFFAAVDTVTDPATGRAVCRVTLTNPTFLPGCVPMNVMGNGNVTRSAYDWARSASRYQTTNTMNYVNANVQGDLFNMPAGPVSAAFGVEYRSQSLEQTSNGDPATMAAAADRAAWFQDIRGVPSSALKFLVANIGIASGSQTVKEGYAELQVPLLKNAPGAKSLDVNLAARNTNYKTSGSVTTWKAGTTWSPIDSLRFRATQSRDIAAPDLYNLYAGANVRNLGVQDPLTNTLVVPQIINQGNVNLKPETADTTALGIVIQPTAISGLTASVDAYRINIKGAIQTTSETAELAECNASGGTAPVCALIIRPFPYSNTTPANAPTQIYVLPQNLAKLTTKGVDIDISYTTGLQRLLPSIGGTLTLRAFGNYLDQYDTQAASNQPLLHHAGRVLVGYASPGLPRFHALFSETYARGDIAASLTERYTGNYYVGMTEVFAADFPTHMPSRTYVDFNLSYDLKSASHTQVFFNVQNLFDVAPPVQQFGAAQGLNTPTDTAIYDVIGSYFTVGFRLKY